MPRTTLNLDAPILEDLKQLQRREGGSLGQIASRLLAAALATRCTEARRAPQLAWHSQPMQARINLEDKDALWAALDRCEPAETPPE